MEMKWDSDFFCCWMIYYTLSERLSFVQQWICVLVSLHVCNPGFKSWSRATAAHTPPPCCQKGIMSCLVFVSCPSGTSVKKSLQAQRELAGTSNNLCTVYNTFLFFFFLLVNLIGTMHIKEHLYQMPQLSMCPIIAELLTSVSCPQAGNIKQHTVNKQKYN